MQTCWQTLRDVLAPLTHSVQAESHCRMVASSFQEDLTAGVARLGRITPTKRSGLGNTGGATPFQATDATGALAKDQSGRLHLYAAGPELRERVLRLGARRCREASLQEKAW